MTKSKSAESRITIPRKSGSLFESTCEKSIELAVKRITCNAVEPGLTLTDSVDRMIPPDVLKQMESGIPLGRAVYAKEIADAFVYLASDDGAMMTGQALTIDGGASLGSAQAMAFDDH